MRSILKKIGVLAICFFAGLILQGCSGDDEAPSVKLLSITVDGVNLTSSVTNIPVTAEVNILFGSAVSQAALSDQISFTSGGTAVPFTLTLSNASTKAILSADLEYETEYALKINTGPIGANGEALDQPVEGSFETATSGIITEANPCTSAGSCLKTVNFTTPEGSASLDYYANYPIYEPSASWEKLTSAIIVVHGANRNADDYFNYMTKTLSDESLSESVILISPRFKDDAEAASGELYWSSNAWREGQNSGGSVKLSAFSLIDSLVSQLSNNTLFPVLEKIVVTGHSSGGLFTHVYAAANRSDNVQNPLEMEYVVANSQYFYYSNDFRYDESDGQYFMPDDCALFNSWPMGANNLPPYLGSTTGESINEQFFDRNITYLLGNGSGADPALNTSNCQATLLGSTRYSRGENAFRHTMEYFPATAAHQKVVVEGIGHDGKAMYQSPEFVNLLHSLVD